MGCRSFIISNRQLHLDALGDSVALQRLLHMPQVEFALGDAESSAKASESGKSWGMCVRQCRALHAPCSHIAQNSKYHCAMLKCLERLAVCVPHHLTHRKCRGQSQRLSQSGSGRFAQSLSYQHYIAVGSVAAFTNSSPSSRHCKAV